MLLLTDCKAKNAWYTAAYLGNVDAMREIWELAKEILTTEEMENEMLLRTDGEGRNDWHIAAYSFKIDVIQKIWELAK